MAAILLIIASIRKQNLSVQTFRKVISLEVTWNELDCRESIPLRSRLLITACTYCAQFYICWRFVFSRLWLALYPPQFRNTAWKFKPLARTQTQNSQDQYSLLKVKLWKLPAGEKRSSDIRNAYGLGNSGSTNRALLQKQIAKYGKLTGILKWKHTFPKKTTFRKSKLSNDNWP